MYTEFFDPEIVRAAFLLGIVLAILCYERLQVTTSSIVVPGYLGLAWYEPQLVATTFLVAGVVYLAIHSWSARFVVLSRASKFHLAVIVAAVLQTVLVESADLMGSSGDLSWMSIGFVIPGLIAHDMARQGPWKTVAAVSGASLIVALAVGAAILFLPEFHLAPEVFASQELAFGSDWLPSAMLISVIASVALQRNYGLRCGGFVGAAYISQMVMNPLELLCYAAFAGLTYVIVAIFLKPRLMLFGRRKFAAMIMVGCLVSWVGSWLGALWFSPEFFGSMCAGRAVISVFLAGLIANDVERSGVWIALRGTGLCVAFTLCCTLTLIECLGPARPEVVAPFALVIFVMTAWFFAPDLRRLGTLLSPVAQLQRRMHLATPSKTLAIQRRDFAFNLRQIGQLAACVLMLAALAMAAGLFPEWNDARASERSPFATTETQTGSAHTDGRNEPPRSR